MEHAFQPVDVLDVSGRVIGTKLRRDINKQTDIYHGVFALITTPQRELIMRRIPVREDLPNLYSNLYGTPMSTMRRHGETAKKAVERGLSRELFIDDIKTTLLGEKLFTLVDGHTLFASTYTAVSELPDEFSTVDISLLTTMTRNKFEAMLYVKPENASPSLRALWQHYNKDLAL